MINKISSTWKGSKKIKETNVEVWIDADKYCWNLDISNKCNKCNKNNVPVLKDDIDNGILNIELEND